MEQLPFMTAIPLNLHSAAFVAWIGGLCAGVALMIRGRKRHSELTRDLGIALFIGGFLGLSINQLEFRESRRLLSDFQRNNEQVSMDTEKLIQDLRTDITTAYFGREIPKDMSDQIKSIILDPFYYVTCDVELTLSEPQENITPGYLRMDIDAHFVVRNLAKEAHDYVLAVSLSDLHATRSPGMKRIWVTSNVDPSKNLDLNEVQARTLLGFQPSPQLLEFERSFKMEPKEELDIHMRSYAYPAERDMYLLIPRHPCHRLEMRVNLPDTSYVSACGFNHPGVGDVAQCICHDEEPGFVKAEIEAAVLPYQGITIEWGKKNVVSTAP